MRTKEDGLFAVLGTVVNAADLSGIGGLRVEAWDKDLICDDLVGSAVTNEDGTFQIRFNESYFQELFADRRPDLFFKVFYSDALIKSTEENVLWNIGSCDRIVVIEVDFAAESNLGDAAVRRLAISGMLLNKDNGYPLAGLTVRAFSVGTLEEGGTVEPELDSPLVESVSETSGRFSLRFDGLESSVKGFVLICEDAGGSVIFTSAPYSLSKPAENLILQIPIEEPCVDLALWPVLAERMKQTRVVQLHELVRQLCAVGSGNTVFSDLGAGVRLAIVTELESAFLDPDGVLRSYAAAPSFVKLNSAALLNQYAEQFEPYLDGPGVKNALDELTGKLDAFSSLLEVDWVMDVDALKEGDTNLAVNKFSAMYTVSFADERSTGFEANPDFQFLVPTELSRYRDYLRTVFTGPEGTETFLHNTDSLQRRFQQDFETLDTQARPANSILIGILKDILTSLPGEHYGFGFLAGSIEDQGQRSDREYLDYLIGLTQLSAEELGLRYRLDFERSDLAMSNRVQENITTLQRFYSDGYQSKQDPFPIIPERLLGKAPFFLYYEEWVQQKKPFHPENYYGFKGFWDTNLGLKASHFAWYRELDLEEDSASLTPQQRSLKQLIDILDTVREGYEYFKLGEFGLAFDRFRSAHGASGTLLNQYLTQYAEESEIIAAFGDNKLAALSDIEDLERFSREIFDTWGSHHNPGFDGLSWDAWWENNASQLVRLISRLYFSITPTYIGDTLLETGDYRNAVYYYGCMTFFPIGMAKSDNYAGYREYHPGAGIEERLFHAGSLGYTANLFSEDEYPHIRPYDDTIYYHYWEYDTVRLRAPIREAAHPMEKRFFRLRQGAALLEWADALYRSDEAPNVQRARDLYKAVLLLHGKEPPIDPTWGRLHIPGFTQHAKNPALTAQTSHALRGFYQIEAGLNYFGANEDMVPTLRYRTLKSAADRFAESAKAAQQDFLFYTASLEKLLEEAIRERLATANALKKAALLGQIAGEQIEIAKHGVKQAEQQVANVQAAIQAKKDEIEESEGFLNQVKDFGKGFVGAVGDVSGMVSGAGGATAPKEIFKAFTEGGSAAGVMSGYGLFIYGSYASMSSMEDAYNSRKDELDALVTRALPAARELVKVREREVKIYQLQQKIALADAEYAMALAEAIRDFQRNRFLNSELWAKLAAVMKQVMRRYIELGVRYAWLAERALAYEQDRAVRIIRFDYFPRSLQGVTGADLLKLDLAELEGSYLDNIKPTLPVKKTYSLAFDYPLQFAQLKKTGKCTFRTEERPYRYRYPGFYGYRIHTIGVRGQETGAMPQAVGILKNDGISTVSRNDGQQYVLRREPVAFPLSEFRLSDDLALYGLPNDAQFAFEGSGIETSWILELPEDANPKGLKDVADILLTFDMRAHFSADLYQSHIAEKRTSAQRMVLLSARSLQPQTLEELQQGAATATFNFDLRAAGLPRNELNRELKNLMIFLASKDASETRATIKSTMLQNGVSFSFNQGLALSNAGPLHSSSVTSELDQFIDQDATQGFEVTINVADNPGVDFTGVRDMVLGVEYLARY
jgi:hypothetical protein